MKAKSLNKTASGGLHKDNSPMTQPDNTTTFVLNGITDSVDGDNISISNEPGNELCYELKPGYIPIGHIPMIDDEVVVFSTNGTFSEIGIVDGCKYTAIVSNNECLNFSTQHPIKGEFKYARGCERIIYFYDGINSDKTLNFERLNDFKVNGVFDCAQMSLSPEYQIPNIELISVNDIGGYNVDVGSYKFAIKYLTDSSDATDYIKISDTIPIHDDTTSGSTESIDGAYPLSAGFDVNVGAVPPTTKSITLRFTNLDLKFDRIEITVIRYNNGDGITSTAYKLESLPITNNILTWTFTGINSNNATLVDRASITVNRQIYNTSKAMGQSSNRLIRANLIEKYRDWGLFQQQSNNILSEWVMEESLLFDVNDSNHPKNAAYYYDKTSYMRDEVYAFGIIYEFSDGSESPVFHIPGRDDLDPRINLIEGNAHSFPNGTHQRNLVPTGLWDRQILSVISSVPPGNTPEVSNLDVEHLGLTTSNTIQRWKVWNTATKFSNQEAGLMGYYETENDYPDDLACNGQRVYPEGKIRHHRMPDNKIAPLFNRNIVNSTTDEENDYFKRILGVKFTNIIPPSEYANEITGWRIVRGEKTNVDRSVLDKGIYFGTLAWDTNKGTKTKHIMQRSKFNTWATRNDTGNLIDAFIPEGNLALTSGFDCYAGTGELVTNVSKDTNNHWSYISPLTMLKDVYLGTSHIQYELLFDGELRTYINNNSGGSNREIEAHEGRYFSGLFRFNDATSRKIDDAFFLPFNSEIVRNGLIIDNRTQQKTYMFQAKNINDIEDGLQNATNFGRPFETNKVLTRVHYISMKNENNNIHNNIENIKYIQTTNKSTSNSEVTIFGGDTFVGPYYHRHTLNGTACGSISKKKGIIRNAIIFVTESYINFELRHGNSIDACGNYLPRTFSGGNAVILSSNNIFDETIGKNSSDIVKNLFREYVFNLDKDDVAVSICPNFYEYNDDYSVLNDYKYYFGHQTDWCDLCLHEHKNRVAWSQPSLNEDKNDAYRSFLSNDYKEIGLHSGEVTNMYPRNNRELYITTDQSLFKLHPSSQEIQTNQEVLYIGTGTFLSVPEVELARTDYGYAGNQGRFNMEVTEKGAFYIDQQAGKVFQIGDNLRLISDTGMHHWFKENLPCAYCKQYLEHTGVDYPYQDMIPHDLGVGVHAVYDPRFERYIIHKKDFEITDIDDLINNLNFQDVEEEINIADINIDLSELVDFQVSGTYVHGPAIVPQDADLIMDFGIRYDLPVGTPSDVVVSIYKNGALYRTLVQSTIDPTEWRLHSDIDSDIEGDGYTEVDFFRAGDTITLTINETNSTGRFINEIYFTMTSPYQKRTKKVLTVTSGSGIQNTYTVTTDSQLGTIQDDDDPTAQCSTVITVQGIYTIDSTLNYTTSGSPSVSSSVRVNGLAVGTVGIPFTMQLNVGDIVDIYSTVGATDYITHDNAQLVLVNESYLPELDQIPDEYLLKKSWTMSYSTKDGVWSSWHSYMPLFWYNDHETFYSTRNNKVWRHLARNSYGIYYGIPYDHIVEFVVSAPQTTLLHSVQWIANTEEWDSINQFWISREDTYNTLLAYNSCQTTAEQTLQLKTDPYSTVNWNNLTKYVNHHDNHYKTAQLRDLSITNASMMTSDPSVPQYSSFFNPTGNGYIDKVANPAAYDVNKSFYELAELKDKYFFVRLMYNNLNNDYKITLDLANTMNKLSIR